MNTTHIKPVPGAANWLRVSERDGYVSISRVNADGETLQSLTVLPDEAQALIALLTKHVRAA